MRCTLSRGVFAASLLLAAACRTAAVAPARVSVDSAAIHRDIAYLASDDLEGRGTGTAGNDSAAAYIARRFAELGLREPDRVCDSSTRIGFCDGRYLQRFLARSVMAAHAGLPTELETRNVVAVLRGRDAELRDEFIVLGAHMDHLGRSTFGALDARAGDVIRNGADDNASGTAAVMELARVLSRRPPKRSVVFVLFSGEELGLLGSQHFVDHSPVPLDKVSAMLNFDMVGRLTNGQVMVMGVGSAAELPAIVDSANTDSLDVRAIPDGRGGSDHASFLGAGVPALHFFTGLHDDYHRASDDTERVNVAGIVQVVELAERVAREIADRPALLTRTTRAAAPRVADAAPRAGGRPYLGSVPDMGAVGVVGVRLSDVTPGSPADRAGLRKGDVVVELDGAAVTDLQSYSDALYARRPGDEVTVVVERAGQRVAVRATLGTRGS